MTPEQRLDRLERIAKLMVNAGLRRRKEFRRESREQSEQINILIHFQMETTEQIKGLAVAQAETDKAVKGLAVAQAETDKAVKGLAVAQAETAEIVKELAVAQKKTDYALRAFLSRREGQTGNP
jgi:hypothetical protein